MNDPFFDHLVEVNRIFTDQIKTADQKAAYVFTFLLAMLVWSSEARHSFSISGYVGRPWEIAAVSFVLSLSIITALVAAVLVVLPRAGRGRSFLYWGAWPNAGRQLVEARGTAEPEYLFAEYLENTKTLAEIARIKYRIVRVAFLALLCTVVSYALLLMSL